MNILLFLNIDKTLGNRNRELLNMISYWKKSLDLNLHICCAKEENFEILKKDLKKWGIDKLHLININKDEFEYNINRAYAYINKIVIKNDIKCILMGNTIFEKELASFIASSLNWDYLPNVIGVGFDNDNIISERFMYGTRAKEKSKNKFENVIITCSSNIFNKSENIVSKNFNYSLINLEFNKVFPYILKYREPKKIQRNSLETARIVVGVGKGIKSKENFRMIEELAELLGATIGVTRSVVDNGWRPEYEKIGQTGKIIQPELYIGFGISGAMQHMAGVQQARHIIMVNINPNAECFNESDLGIVGDLFDIIPMMIDFIKNN